MIVAVRGGSPDGRYGRALRGLQGTREWISDTREVWENYDQKVEEIVDLVENVVVVVRIAGRGGGSGVPVSQELAVVWTFDGDQALRARSFTSRAEALETAGLPK
jgi:ketosteroid isomerase-like protein